MLTQLNTFGKYWNDMLYPSVMETLVEYVFTEAFDFFWHFVKFGNFFGVKT